MNLGRSLHWAFTEEEDSQGTIPGSLENILKSIDIQILKAKVQKLDLKEFNAVSWSY
jgi:hypothetical protein